MCPTSRMVPELPQAHGAGAGWLQAPVRDEKRDEKMGHGTRPGKDTLRLTQGHQHCLGPGARPRLRVGPAPHPHPKQSPARPQRGTELAKSAQSTSPAKTATAQHSGCILEQRPQRSSPATGTGAERCSHHQNPAISGRCSVHPISSCRQTSSNSQ